MIERAVLAAHLDNILSDATIPELPNHYRGKVRDNYDLPDRRRIIIATDRLSAFDRIITAIPFKGQVLTQIARFWFDATPEICPNHVIEYPDGLHQNQRLPSTIVTPTTKAFDGGHDEPLTPAEITGRGLLTDQQWNATEALALALFARGREIAEERGLILVDTKYEFGFDEAGQIILADEIHTPDSSRYWIRDSYERRFAAGQPPESLDKDFVRRWVSERCDPYRDPIPQVPHEVILEAARLYIGVFETITGQSFVLPEPDIPPLAR